jgi:hypothetical protein
MAYTQQTPIGTPDVNLITKTLASLQPDSALQQYAALHKNNPYILSLAKSEADRRKSLRMAAQGNPGQMPTVADREIAGMAAPVMTQYGGALRTGSGGRVQTELPEDQGIAQIPAPNMQSMADGGIAGYGDGDDVPKRNGMAMGGMYDFAQRSEPVVRMAGGGHIPRYQGNTTDGSVVRSNPMFNIPGMTAVQPRAEFTQAGAPENTPFFQRIFDSIKAQGKEATLFEIEGRIKKGIATEQEKAFYQSEKIKGGDKAAAEEKYPAKDAVRTKDFPGVQPGFEKLPAETASDKTADKTQEKPPVPPVVNLPTGGMSVKQAQDLAGQFYNLKDIKGQLEQVQMQERQDIANEQTARAEKLAAFNKEQGPAMAGYEKLLKSEEMQDATDKEKAGLMSLMKGFLAIAGGESPNAAVNIAKGAMVGLGDYGDALKEFKKSAKERNKAMAEIENARRAEAKGDLKDAQVYEDKANDYLRASRQSGIKAVMDATGKSAEISSSIYKSAIDNASANARTNAQLTAPSSQMQLFSALGKGDIEKGLGVYANVMGPDAKGDQAIIAKYSGPQGQIALQMLEASGPEGKAQAQLIKQIIKQNTGSMLKPTSTPTGPVRE